MELYLICLVSIAIDFDISNAISILHKVCRRHQVVLDDDVLSVHHYLRGHVLVLLVVTHTTLRILNLMVMRPCFIVRRTI